MDNLWSWLLGIVLSLIMAVIYLRVTRRPAPVAKKPEIRRLVPMVEIAEEISPTTPPIKREEEDIYIPHCYGVDRLVVLPQDPYWLHAYWEVSAAKQREFIATYGDNSWHLSRQMLRVYDITDHEKENPEAYGFQEIYLDPFADNWFIEVGQPDRSFLLELGRLLPDGRYVKLLISNKVTTPRASISPRIDEQWLWLAGVYQSIGKTPYGSSELLVGHEGFGPLGISSPVYKQ